MSERTHEDVVRREFARQAPSFASKRSWFGATALADWIPAHMPLDTRDSVLDVCGGAGHLARRLAPRVREVVVLDLTPQQLEVGRSAVAREGIGNVRFVEGDAAAMPFAASAFDAVVSRFAFHHLPDQGAVVADMARVVRPGGHVAIMDMINGGGDHHRLERLRDPSHTRAFTEPELVRMLTDVGAEVVTRSERRELLPVEPWLAQAAPPADALTEIRAALSGEADGGTATGLHAFRDETGTLHIAQDWLIVVATLAVNRAGGAYPRLPPLRSRY